MIKSIATKNFIKKILGHFNYELHSTESKSNPFFLQSKFVKNSNPMIFDIGAHVGTVTEMYRGMFPSADIHSFEPFPDSFNKLQKGLGKKAGSFCHNVAVSDKDGSALFNSNAISTTNSLLATDEKGSEFWGKDVLDTQDKIEVKTITLDTFCRENNIDHVDILKIDTQGAEFSVFTGAKDILSKQKVSLIYSELIMCPTYEGQHDLHEYFTLLDSFGYEFLDFYNPVRKHNQLIQADVIFVNPSLKKEIQG